MLTRPAVPKETPQKFLLCQALLHRQLVKHLAQVTAKLNVKRLPPALRDEHNVIFAVPGGVA
jgi:hypothetical protein